MSDVVRPVYQNDRYWSDRLERDFSLAGVGHAGVGLAFNRWAYKVRREVLLRTLRQFSVRIKGSRILELGFGTGFYLDIWKNLDAAHVVGFDITDIAVRSAQERFNGWNFAKADIGTPLPLGKEAGNFDIATAFDVLFHLVEDSAWNGALDNICAALKPGGHAVIFDKCQNVETSVGHVRRRTLDAYEDALARRGFAVKTVRPLFVLMNSPTDLSGWQKPIFKGGWSLAKMPYKFGNLFGAGEFFGNLSGAALFYPELAMTRLLKRGPSTKLLLARKK